MPSKHAFSVSLTEHLASFVRAEIAEGRYGTVSEVVRAGLRLLEEEIARRATPARLVDAAPTARVKRPDDRGRTPIKEKA
nr:type II toxin-antitoxin system ParD family antitoxin [Paraburkholderia rhynchosiae]